jgi:drug/metabolite transporter (DMT)-like permease
LFTKAFALTTNYTIPILIQKLQPLFAIIFARIFLGERLHRRFWVWALLAAVGAYVVSFGTANAFASLAEADALPVLYALAAAAIWGGATVAGRILLAARGFLFVTSARFTLAAVVLLMLVAAEGGLPAVAAAPRTDFYSFSMMAVVSGLLALLIYYFGLQRTRASVATLAELAFPVGAIVINWLFLAGPMSVAQLAGAGMLLAAVTALSFGQKSKDPPAADFVRGIGC